MGLVGNAKIELFGDALPSDVLVQKFVAFERLSEPYRVVVEFVTEDTGVILHELLRKRALLVVTDARGRARYFDGLVEQADFLRAVEQRLVFSLILRPALSALAFRTDSRIFQELSIPDIVKQLFAEVGLSETAEFKLTRSYLPREFVVQYRESTLDFVHRLLQEVGIFYFFCHDETGHRMVLADDASRFEPAPDDLLLSLSPELHTGGEPLFSFSQKRTLATTEVLLRDFDFEKPQLPPESTLSAADRVPALLYEYPGRFVKSAEGNLLVRARLAAERARARVGVGVTAAVGLWPGQGVKVVGGEHEELDGEWVVTELISAGRQRDETGSENFDCRNEFRAIPKQTAYAPPRVTPKPRIAGIQTAVVTGDNNADQAIFTDSYGRIKVRFPWDRIGQENAGSSCWIRTLQIPMGGAMVLPRVGWEVSVAFLEGDPDRPVVLGRVYNGKFPPPMSLPGGKASGCLKSMSSPGSTGHNQISMGDSGGSQGHGMQAQKDLNIVVGNDCTETVAVDDKHDVSVSMVRSIGANETISVGANQTVSVGKNLSSKIGAGQTISVGANDDSNATGNFLEKIGGSRSYTVGSVYLTISNGVELQCSGLTQSVGAAQLVVTGGDLNDSVVGSTTSTVSAARVHVVAGNHGETVSGAKTETIAGAALHMIKGDSNTEAAAAISNLVGGIHLRQVGGDYSVKALTITLLGAIGELKGGGSKVSLSGGPVTLKGSNVAIKAAMIRRTGVNLKIM